MKILAGDKNVKKKYVRTPVAWIHSLFQANRVMATELGLNSTAAMPTVNVTDMDFFPQNDSAQWSSNATNGNMSQPGPGFTFVITPSGFPRVQVYMYIVFAVMGVVNNSLTIKILHSLPKKPFYTYLQGLASVDLIFVSCAGIFVSYMWDGTVSTFAHGFFICRVSTQMLWACAKCSTTITAVVALERALSILFPFVMMRSNPGWRVKYVLITIAVVVLASQCGIIAMFGPIPYGDEGFFCSWSPTFFSPLGQTLILINACLFEYAMPILLLLSNICLITQLAVSRARRGNLQAGENQSASSSADHHITLMLIGASILSLVSNTPATLIRLLKVPRNMYGGLRLFVDLLYVFERTANLYIYFAVNKEFRTAAKVLFVGKQAAVPKNSLDKPVSNECSDDKKTNTTSADNPAFET